MSVFRNSGAITNVRVFTGSEFTSPQDISFENGLITQITPAAIAELPGWPPETPSARTTTIDGNGKYLIPGFIDSHVHVRDETQLCHNAQHGVTTVLDMSCSSSRNQRTLRRPQPGHAAFFSSGPAAVIVGSESQRRPGVPQEHAIQTGDAAIEFVRQLVRDQADYIKLICEDGCDERTISTLVAEAKTAGKITVAQASSLDTYRKAQASGANVITYTPLDAEVDEKLAQAMAAAGQIGIPKLGRLGESNTEFMRDDSLDKGLTSVRRMYTAGVTILAGTIAAGGESAAEESTSTTAPGSSLTTELDLLAQAGLSPLEVLRSATTEPAKRFNLNDRGAIEIGKRADLVMLSGNPLENRRALGYVEHVWCVGVRVAKGCLVCGQTRTERHEWSRRAG